MPAPAKDRQYAPPPKREPDARAMPSPPVSVAVSMPEIGRDLIPVIRVETKERIANTVALKANADTIAALTMEVRALAETMSGGFDL